MKLIEKIGLIIFFELIGVLFFIKYDPVIASVLFAPIFTVTVYMFVLLIMKKSTIRKDEIIFTLFIISVSLFSVGLGFHLTADMIANLPELEQESELINQYIYYLDEILSHQVLLVGVVATIVSMVLIGIFGIKEIVPVTKIFNVKKLSLDKVVDVNEMVKNLKKLGEIDTEGIIKTKDYIIREIEKQVSKIDVKDRIHQEVDLTMMDLFVMSFLACFIGAVSVFLSIEGQVLSFIVVISAFMLILVLSIITKMKEEFRFTYIFFMITVTSFLAFLTAYYITRSSIVQGICF